MPPEGLFDSTNRNWFSAPACQQIATSATRPAAQRRTPAAFFGGPTRQLVEFGTEIEI